MEQSVNVRQVTMGRVTNSDGLNFQKLGLEKNSLGLGEKTGVDDSVTVK